MTTTINFDALDKFIRNGGTIELHSNVNGITVICDEEANADYAYYGNGYESVYEALEDASGMLGIKK